MELFKRIDILVNGAAGNFLASADKLSTNGFRTVLEIDAVGTFNMSQAVFTGYMKEHKGGVIINISATIHWSGSALQVHANSAKSAVDTMTKTLAVEWGPYNVRVVGIAPGAIEGTEGFDRLQDLASVNNKQKANSAFNPSSQQSKSAHIQVKGAINRFGTVADIAGTALFLASPLTSYITGTNIVVDGGASLIYPNFLF